MPETKSKSEYTYASLKKRGWTDSLIRALLPKPRVIHTPQYPQGVRLWKRAEVFRAEQGERFKAERRPAAEQPSRPAAARPSAGARAALEAIWAAAEPDETDAGLLALHCHRGILARLSAAERRPLSSVSRAEGWIGEFLTLEKRGGEKQLADALKRFTRAWASVGGEDGPVFARVRERYVRALRAASARALEEFAARQPEADLHALLTAPGFPDAQLAAEGLGTVWSVWYVPQAIRTSLSLLIALNPKDEYPDARAMRRRFILHLGGTNTGKTYAGFQRLISAESGVYLAPLRLLALEAQETLLDSGVNCSLSTGEEEDIRRGDTHLAATAEKLPMDRRWDVAVIDECQMISDAQRGYAWTRAILGVLAPEVHLCAAPEARGILIRLIESCGDSWEIELHERTTPLVCMAHTTDYTRVRPGDALITFSKVGVLSVAEDLRAAGKEPAIIYGALPYSTRRRQMEGFLNGDMEYIVSTDAIGMGLNLPIRRIIFMETEKFDGVERRPLKPEEIKQIAGRAGRRGMYPRGYVGATENLAFIRAGLEAAVPPIRYAVTGFSELVLQVDFDLLEVLTEWNKLPTAEPYRKLDISRYIAVISKIREMGFTLTKEQELRAANIPFDENEDALRELFFRFLGRYMAGLPLEQPSLASPEPTLPELEQYYRKLDLYFSFAKAFDCEIDSDALYETRESVADQINEILLHRLRSNIRFCAACGKPLPLHYHSRLCKDCWRKREK